MIGISQLVLQEYYKKVGYALGRPAIRLHWAIYKVSGVRVRVEFESQHWYSFCFRLKNSPTILAYLLYIAIGDQI